MITQNPTTFCFARNDKFREMWVAIEAKGVEYSDEMRIFLGQSIRHNIPETPIRISKRKKLELEQTFKGVHDYIDSDGETVNRIILVNDRFSYDFYDSFEELVADHMKELV